MQICVLFPEASECRNKPSDFLSFVNLQIFEVVLLGRTPKCLTTRACEYKIPLIYNGFSLARNLGEFFSGIWLIRTPLNRIFLGSIFQRYQYIFIVDDRHRSLKMTSKIPLLIKLTPVSKFFVIQHIFSKFIPNI